MVFENNGITCVQYHGLEIFTAVSMIQRLISQALNCELQNMLSKSMIVVPVLFLLGLNLRLLTYKP